MSELIIAFILILTGFFIGLIKDRFSKNKDLAEVSMYILLVMGWFQTFALSVNWFELLLGFKLTDISLATFIGVSSLSLTGVSIACISYLNRMFNNKLNDD